MKTHRAVRNSAEYKDLAMVENAVQQFSQAIAMKHLKESVNFVELNKMATPIIKEQKQFKFKYLNTSIRIKQINA